MKKTTACLLLTTGLSLAAKAATLEDSFDWGSGISGRETVTNGQNINGMAVQTGGVSWVRGSGVNVFSGIAGAGNGSLTMTGGNAIVYCNYAVTGQVTATMEYVHQTVSTSGVNGVWLGFTSSGGNLLNSDAYEKVYVYLQPKTGKIFAGVTTLSGTNIVDNVDKNVALGGFTQGDRLIMTLTVNTEALSAVATISNVTQGVANSLTFGWTEPGIALTSLAINETSSQIILIDAVRAAPERSPQSGLLFALQNKLGPLDVYVCAGQSNMAGAGEKAELPAELQAPQPNVFVFDGSSWALMEPTATGVGPEISFAYEMQKALNKPIGIILHAKGGTNLATNWNPLIAANLYTELTNKVNAAGQTREIHVKGMIWMQGENDSRYLDMATAYGQNLTNLIQAARADFNGSGMPFVAGRVDPPYAYAALVRTAQETCTADPYAWINCDDLTRTEAGGLHYDTAGLVEMGKRFAQSILSLQ